ncbi:phage antirepressor KilAC domain-containing protein [Larkinella sp. C7]|uniref:phage antirepressor KilAC domain-containing protein n=1 Tax=Larkinella sp. C7 TaxID=2576607 RepID=UPI00111154E2|nr:phage antirepressor KilAC domain-containing protein [Larkinella sp. C7]
MIPFLNYTPSLASGIRHSQIKKYKGNPIEFEIINHEVYANATGMCKPFEKRPIDWIRLPDSQRYIQASQAKCENLTLIQTRRGGSNPSTWIHQKLIVVLARWLDVDFAVQCDEWVAELLRTGKVEVSSKEYSRKELALMILQAEEEKEQLLLENAQLRPKAAYADKVLASVDDITTTIIAKELGLSAKQLNQLLVQRRVQYYHDGQYILYAPYQNKGLSSSRTHVYTNKERKSRTRHYLVWTEKGRAFIHRLLNSSPTSALALPLITHSPPASSSDH